MLLFLWNLLRGYVVIEVSGFSVERFVNLAVHRGVYIWDMHHSEGSAVMKVSVKGFKLLKNCAKKTKCKVKIVSKKGLPFIMFRYRKRKILMFGIAFFIFVLYFLSSFIWLVEIEGYNRLTYDRLNSFCIEQGLRVGTLKRDIDIHKLELALRDNFSEISWINIHIKGTKATVKLTESPPKAEIPDKTVPCNIVAKKDGLITSIITSAGTPKVKQMDIVKTGDVLVSGELIVTESEAGVSKKYVHAEAEVWAKMYYEINLEVPYQYTEKVYTGRTEKSYTVGVLNKNLNLIKSSNSFQNYDRITSKSQPKFGDNYPLPIIISIITDKEFEPMPRQRDIEQAKELADRMVTSRIIREFDFEADIIDKTIAFEDLGDRLAVKAIITLLERIDEVQELTGSPQEE